MDDEQGYPHLRTSPHWTLGTWVLGTRNSPSLVARNATGLSVRRRRRALLVLGMLGSSQMDIFIHNGERPWNGTKGLVCCIHFLMSAMSTNVNYERLWRFPKKEILGTEWWDLNLRLVWQCLRIQLVICCILEELILSGAHLWTMTINLWSHHSLILTKHVYHTSVHFDGLVQPAKPQRLGVWPLRKRPRPMLRPWECQSLPAIS